MKSALFIKVSTAVILSTVNCSCQKEDNVAKTADAIEGEYELVSMHWDGNPIDIDGDGIATKDILPELISVSIFSNKEFHTDVYPTFRNGADGEISFTIPMQGISIKYYSGLFNKNDLIGGSMNCIILSYEIQDDGTIEIEHFDSLNMPKDDSRVEMKNISDGNATFDLSGKLLFSVNYTFYDHKTDQLVTDRVHYTYVKL